jgi:hypothetical protein
VISCKKSMNFDLIKEQQEIQKAVDEFAKRESGKAVALDFEQSHRFPFAILKKASGVAQKYHYISSVIFNRLNGLERGYKRTEIYVHQKSVWPELKKVI